MPHLNIVAVTACVSGVAHTYMAAEQLEKQCRKLGYKVKVETQGALGIENALSEGDIAEADVAILVTDISIEGQERFAGCRTVKLGIQKLLTHPQAVLAAIDKVRNLQRDAVISVK